MHDNSGPPPSGSTKRLPVAPRVLTLAALALMVVAELGAPSVAGAQERGPLVGAPPIMRETLWREGRVSITPKFGFTIGDPYQQNLLPGFDVTYFILDWLGVGVDFGYGIPLETDLTASVNRELTNKRRAVCPPGPGGQQDEACLAALGVTGAIGTSHIQFLTTLQVSFAPIRGKMMLWGSLIRYDALFSVGAVYGRIKGMNGIGDDNAFGPSVSIAGRLFFNEWIGLQLEARDFLLQYHRATDQRGNEFAKDFHNHIMFSVGLTMSFPRTPRVAAVD